jgi:hypothetical protein
MNERLKDKADPRGRPEPTKILIDPQQCDGVVIQWLGESVSNTNKDDIVELCGYINAASEDKTVYDIPKNVGVDLYRGTNIWKHVDFSGPVFRLEGRQYYGESPAIERILGYLLRQSPLEFVSPLGGL